MSDLYRRICEPTDPHRNPKMGSECDETCFVRIVDDEEYVGRQRLSDWQHENQVNDNFSKMDRYR